MALLPALRKNTDIGRISSTFFSTHFPFKFHKKSVPQEREVFIYTLTGGMIMLKVKKTENTEF